MTEDYPDRAPGRRWYDGSGEQEMLGCVLAVSFFSVGAILGIVGTLVIMGRGM